MTRIALIDYGSGNLHSCARALAAAADDPGKVRVTARPEDILTAERIVLPGVGHFADCAGALRAIPGMVEALEEAVLAKGRPFLGICVGMQLLADTGLEDGETPGLGWVHGIVEKLEAAPGLPVPHVGWNELMIPAPHPVLAGLGDTPHAYFTHSYAFRPEEDARVSAWTDYGAPIAAALARDNIFGTQFHPEKSQRLGLTLLANFLKWRP
ncbi:imidazole glycerol phosphate synthase subunit HisH [Hyphomonas sp. WL0036]|uniref:imidazole glycerol phosphate synthase subunit HisH n=1 Tax=Hyphomonas sediminis TaxID=2866160 RepID=UPI001C804392|nr:imidazole glycerol phosphate synthase subunit HisH [Hyphomonas sediminis]MBY9065997.1 imidazole glycerol phosphate synthase subunit HisH [Hyphomonas sediminis]